LLLVSLKGLRHSTECRGILKDVKIKRNGLKITKYTTIP
jgi:hypothetical protein